MKNISKNLNLLTVFIICFIIFAASFEPALASLPVPDNAAAAAAAAKKTSTSGSTGAAKVLEGLSKTATKAEITTTETNLPKIAGRAINYFFGVLGVVFLTALLVGGYLWMTAGGNEEKVKKGQGWVVNGINGIIVVFLAYALAYTMLFAMKTAIGG
ncbi:MAG: hypothetical protein WCW26_00370 [Candidatus Buchananbacteria bacterium]